MKKAIIESLLATVLILLSIAVIIGGLWLSIRGMIALASHWGITTDTAGLLGLFLFVFVVIFLTNLRESLDRNKPPEDYR